MATETIRQIAPIEFGPPQQGMIVYPRKFLQQVMDVYAECWLLGDDAQWHPHAVLGEGIVGNNEYDDPYTVCFVPVKDGCRYVKRKNGEGYPIIGGPKELSQQQTYQMEHGRALDIVQPINMDLAHMLLKL